MRSATSANLACSASYSEMLSSSPLIKASSQAGLSVSVTEQTWGERQVEIHGLGSVKGFPHTVKGKMTVIQLLGRQPRES